MPTKAQLQRHLEMERTHFREILIEKMDKIQLLEMRIKDLESERRGLLGNVQVLAKQKVCVGCMKDLKLD